MNKIVKTKKVIKRRAPKRVQTQANDPNKLIVTNYIEIVKNTIDNIDLHMDCLQDTVSKVQKDQSESGIKAIMIELENVENSCKALRDKLKNIIYDDDFDSIF